MKPIGHAMPSASSPRKGSAVIAGGASLFGEPRRIDGINLLPLDGRAKQIARVNVIILGVLSLLKYITVI